MSYDVDIAGKSFNFTYNVSPLFYEHFPSNEDGERRGLNSLDGLTGKQAMSRIADFWESLERERHNLWVSAEVGEPRLCAKYDAKNGWGSLVGALIFIAQIQSACAENPRHRVRIS